MEFIFIREKHEEYGVYGWKLKNKPHFEPFQGMAVAHDCMEHFPDDDGSIGAECMALGASLIVRNMEMYAFYKGAKNPNPVENIASAYIDLYSIYCYGETLFFNAEDEYYKPLKDKHLESCVQLIKRKGIEDLQGNDVKHLAAQSFVKKSIPWIRKGILMAEKRYENWSSFAILEAFMAIEKEADEAIKDENITELYVILNMDDRSVRVIAEEVFEDHSA